MSNNEMLLSILERPVRERAERLLKLLAGSLGTNGLLIGDNDVALLILFLEAFLADKIKLKDFMEEIP